ARPDVDSRPTRRSSDLGTIYQYFRGKEEVLGALAHEWARAALAQLRTWDPAEGRDGLRALIARFVRGYVRTAALQRVWEEASLRSEEHTSELQSRENLV